jgi:hypothetical protein
LAKEATDHGYDSLNFKCEDLTYFLFSIDATHSPFFIPVSRKLRQGDRNQAQPGQLAVPTACQAAAER